jgi:hypothetical protein
MVFKGKYCGLSINLICPLFLLDMTEFKVLIWRFLGVDFGGKGRLRLDQLVFCCLRFWFLGWFCN